MHMEYMRYRHRYTNCPGDIVHILVQTFVHSTIYSHAECDLSVSIECDVINASPSFGSPSSHPPPS
jgi:hypothetical protein